jgi:hypothetical protein
VRRRHASLLRIALALALGFLAPAVYAGAGKAAEETPARLPAGADTYIAAIRAARTTYAYRLNTAGGLLACDSLEGPAVGQGCPEILRRWGPVRASWVDSLASLLSRPETYRGGDHATITYPEFALRFEGEGPWVELILNTGTRLFWVRSPGREPVPGPYDRVLEQLSSLIRAILPPDMALDSNGNLLGPARPLESDYPNRGVAVEYETPPDLIYSVDPRCPAGRSCARDSVRLSLWVGKNGRIHAIRPAAGDSVLAGAATEAAAQWIYRPALAKRRPVATWLDVWVRFPQAR